MIRLLMLALLTLTTLTACNTVQGLGEDIKEGGAAVDRAISK